MFLNKKSHNPIIEANNNIYIKPLLCGELKLFRKKSLVDDKKSLIDEKKLLGVLVLFSVWSIFMSSSST